MGYLSLRCATRTKRFCQDRQLSPPRPPQRVVVAVAALILALDWGTGLATALYYARGRQEAGMMLLKSFRRSGKDLDDIEHLRSLGDET